MTHRRKVRIAGIGTYAPEGRLTNADLEKLVETSDEWIYKRSGIRERRKVAEGEVTSDLGVKAGRRALEAAGKRPEDVDLIYLGTSSPDRVVPASAPYMQHKLGCRNAGACDVLAACSGFMYAINAAWHAVASGESQCCLAVGAEALSTIVNYKDRTTCILFGDGAGAAVLVPSDGDSDILYSRTGCDGSLADLIVVPAGGSALRPTAERLEQGMQFIRMNGREVYKMAVPKFVELIREGLAACSLKMSDLKLIIPHQMNSRMMEAVAQRLDIPMDMMYMNLERYGNTSSASIPLALDEALQNGRFGRGDLILLTAMGAGLTWGTMVLRY